MPRFVVITMFFVFGCTTLSFGKISLQNNEESNTTRAIKGLPFYAFILREFVSEDGSSREINVLMEPNQVSETNLRLLFRNFSRKFPAPISVEVWVYTDVEQLDTLSTNQITDVAPARGATPKEKKVAHQLVYYKRTKDVELFRYNPNYPKVGEKTVILRGRE